MINNLKKFNLKDLETNFIKRGTRYPQKISIDKLALSML